MIKKFALVSIITLPVGALFTGSAGAKVSDGCSTDKPTFIGGTIVGYPDNRAVDAHLGVSIGYRDSTGKFHDLLEDGSPLPNPPNYSFVEHMNPDLPATGSGVGIRNWGRCVSADVTDFFLEGYPKDPPDSNDPDHNTVETQKTDKIRYGSSAYYSGKVTPGQKLNLLFRLPLNFQNGGNTGGIQGYALYQGKYVPKQYISRIRAFPGPGSQCGVEGYSAAADSLVTASNPDRTYYKLDYLAGGQCSATAQGYAFQASCIQVCGAPVKSISKPVKITKGLWPRVDMVFG